MLATLERAQRAFLAHIRHELGTPLNAIIGYSEMVLEDLGPASVAWYVPGMQQIYASGRQLQATVDELMGPARMDSMGPGELELQGLADEIRARLNPSVASVLQTCEELSAKASAGDELRSELSKIRGAADRLGYLVDELVAFIHQEGNDPEVEAANLRASHVLEDAMSAARSYGALNQRGDLRGHLLVVDDSPLNRELLVRRLEKLGHSAVSVDGGRAALRMLGSEPFDIVLLDIMMPDMNGFEVLEHLKSSETLRHVPVIVVSALEELDSVIRCIELGAEDYLPKTFNPILLKARVEASLEKKRLRDNEILLFRQLEDNFKRLQELETLRDSLTGMIVHDLRTPLTSVLGGIETVQTMGELNAMQRECLGIAARGGHNLLGMINDLLDISKMESGSLTLELQKRSPRQLFDSAMQQLCQLADDRKINLSAVSPSDISVEVDTDKVVRTLVNLTGNALKFTPAGGSVQLAARDGEAGSVLFSVADTGEGIPEDEFEHIFEKFGQVSSRQSGRKMSTGLGLTFCKMAVEAHGGHIWLESRLGRGTTFFFTIPA